MRVKSVSAGVVRNGRFAATGKKVAKKNPLPANGRFVPAKIRRTASGDVQVLLVANPAPAAKPKKKRAATPKKRKVVTKKKVVAKRKASPKRKATSPARKRTVAKKGARRR